MAPDHAQSHHLGQAASSGTGCPRRRFHARQPLFQAAEGAASSSSPNFQADTTQGYRLALPKVYRLLQAKAGGILPCMGDFPKHTNARIVIVEPSEEIDAYYNVNLHFLPRVGEHIELFSNLDLKSGHPHVHRLVVVSVEHNVHDISGEDIGHHLATINAKYAEE